MHGAKITGVGSALGSKVVTNDEISSLLLKRRAELERQGLIAKDDPRRVQFESDSEWIVSHTGILERRHAAPDEATSDLAAAAAEKALAMSELRKDKINFLIVATTTPDHPTTPPTASLVQHKLGIPADGELIAFDLTAACTSFVEALFTAYSFIRSGVKAGLVIGSDVMTRVTNPSDRGTFPLLADAAACFVLERVSEKEDQFGLNNFFFGSDGSCAELITVPAGGSRLAITPEMLADPFDQRHKMRMNGRSLFKKVVSLVSDFVIPEALKKAAITLQDIDVLILHQANLRMNQPILKRLEENLGVFQGRAYNNIERVGNTTAAALGLCFSECLEQEIIVPGKRILMPAFGGGLTWGTALINY